MCCKFSVVERFFLIAFVFCLLQSIPACSQRPTETKTAVEKKAMYTERYGYTDMEGSPLRQLARDNAAFGMSLYSQISKNPGNVFFSPYSISEAFALLYAGAKGETATEMERALHITLKSDNLHVAYQDMLKGFDEFVAYKRNPKDENKVRIDIANGLWAQKGFPLRDDFVGTVRNYHRAEPATLDFAGAPEQSCTTINNWISDRTIGMIKDIVTPGSVNASTKLVLANTIYFEAKWSSPFLSMATKEGEFHTLNNSTVTVPMMVERTPYGYTEDSAWQAAELSYRDIPMAMLVILPRPRKFAEVERMLNAEFLASLDNSLQYESLLLTIPKFKFTSPSITLKETLSTLGLKTVFTEKADLSGISTSPLSLADALHKASVVVDEEGTIAAATTVLLMRGSGPSPKKPIEFTADRPFIFLIRDLKSRAVLFMGRVVDPS
jgi:serpin B